MQQLTLLDNAISQFDTVIKTLSGGLDQSLRASPADFIPANEPNNELTAQEKRHSAGLMRVNHTGEVCAQALYQGQALTAKLHHVRQDMLHAAKEEEDHLAWCQKRLNELESSPSKLNPLWYAMSLGIGTAAGLISDKLSLGFVAATEDQVCQHLDNHLEAIPKNDQKSRAVIQQMRADEAKHADAAIKAGGAPFPAPIKRGMSNIAKVMTNLSYRF